MRPATRPRRDTSPWAWRVGDLLGVEIRVHVTLVLVFAWIAVVYVLNGRGVPEMLHGVALTAALFAIVLLHELGHALAARRFGVATRDITLLPIGGISRLERMPEAPAQELIIAVAGPAVNLVLAGLVLLVMGAVRLSPLPRELLTLGSPFLSQLLWMNLSLALFNLLPAFPTDGGRAFRALLALRLPRATATGIATAVGRWMALVLAVIGVFVNPLLVAIALFLYLSATHEATWARLSATFATLPVARGMVSELRPLRSDDPLGRAAALVVSGAAACFTVDDGAGVVGVVTRADLAAGLERLGAGAPVAAIMQTDLETMDAATPLDRAVEKALAGTPVLVARDGAIVGVLTADHVQDLAIFLGPAARTP